MALFGVASARGDAKNAEDETALLGGKCLPLAVQLRKKPMNSTDLRNLAIERYGVHGSRPVLKHLQDHLADFACENGQPSSPSRIRFCPMRFHCVIN